MSNSETQTTNIAAPPALISSDIHHSATRLQHLASTVKSSSCPSNREGLEDSLGGSGLSFLLSWLCLRGRLWLGLCGDGRLRPSTSRE
jgi:hypothetical protein